MQIDSDLQHNIETLKKKLGQNDDIIFYTFSFGDSRQRACLLYIDGLTENKLLAQYVISPLQRDALAKKEGLIEDLSAFFRLSPQRCFFNKRNSAACFFGPSGFARRRLRRRIGI